MDENPKQKAVDPVPHRRKLITVTALMHVGGFALLAYSIAMSSDAALLAGVVVLVPGTVGLYLLAYGHHYPLLPKKRGGRDTDVQENQ